MQMPGSIEPKEESRRGLTSGCCHRSPLDGVCGGADDLDDTLRLGEHRDVAAIELVHGCHAFPDAVATDKGDSPQWLYTVVFDGSELWGPDTDPTIKVSIDAFEPYLEPS